jgi:hypothetical protein
MPRQQVFIPAPPRQSRWFCDYGPRSACTPAVTTCAVRDTRRFARRDDGAAARSAVRVCARGARSRCRARPQSAGDAAARGPAGPGHAVGGCGHCCDGCGGGGDIHRRQGACARRCAGARVHADAGWRGRATRRRARSAVRRVRRCSRARATPEPRCSAACAATLTAACCPGAGGVRCFVCTGSGKVAPQAPSDADSRGARVCQQRRARARRLTPRVAHGHSNAHAGPGAARAGRVPRVQGHGCALRLLSAMRTVRR